MAKQKETTTKKQESKITDVVLSRVGKLQELGQLHLPTNYSASNALQGAFLILQQTKTSDKKPVLQACSNDSIQLALFNMIVQGLSPLKRQCSFIAHGNQLTCRREYQGSIAMAKRLGGVKGVRAQVIYKGDQFTYGVNAIGQKHLTEHIPDIENQKDENIVGAYAIVVYGTDDIELTLMTLAEIKMAWNQGATKGASPAHKNFPGEMCKKTVINRACKQAINSSDDSYLEEDMAPVDSAQEASENMIEAEANGEPLELPEKAEEQQPADEIIEMKVPDEVVAQAAMEFDKVAPSTKADF